MSHLELVCLGKLRHHNLRAELEMLQFYKYNSAMDWVLSACRGTAFQLNWFFFEKGVEGIRLRPILPLQ